MAGFGPGLPPVSSGWRSTGAGNQTGTLLTRPLNFQGRSLRVAVVDRDGQLIVGYGGDRCARLKGDSIDMPVTWNGQSDLAGLTNSAVCLRFELTCAKLYSFWIE